MRKKLERIARALEARGFCCTVDEAKSTLTVVSPNLDGHQYKIVLTLSSKFVILSRLTIDIPEYITGVPSRSIPEVLQFIKRVNLYFNRHGFGMGFGLSIARCAEKYELNLKDGNRTIEIKYRYTMPFYFTVNTVWNRILASRSSVLIISLAHTVASLHPFLNQIAEGRHNASLSYKKWIEKREKETYIKGLFGELTRLTTWTARRALLNDRRADVNEAFMLNGLSVCQHLHYSEAEGWYDLLISIR